VVSEVESPVEVEEFFQEIEDALFVFRFELHFVDIRAKSHVPAVDEDGITLKLALKFGVNG